MTGRGIRYRAVRGHPCLRACIFVRTVSADQLADEPCGLRRPFDGKRVDGQRVDGVEAARHTLQLVLGYRVVEGCPCRRVVGGV